MNKQLLSVFMILMLACAAMVHAQENPDFPGLIANKAATRSLEKAEQLFESGNYKRAYFIYRHELAPIGDKYAQYMVGYMHLTGQGTDTDRVAAAAWYRLAAERGTKEFVMVHKQLLVSMTPEQLAASERKYLDLRKQYGDLPILMKAAREDYDTLKARTGSRLGGDASNVTVVDMRRGGTAVSADRYYAEVADRLKARLEMMDRYTQVEIVDLDIDTIDLDAIEQQVNEELESLD